MNLQEFKDLAVAAKVRALEAEQRFMLACSPDNILAMVSHMERLQERCNALEKLSGYSQTPAFESPKRDVAKAKERTL